MLAGLSLSTLFLGGVICSIAYYFYCKTRGGQDGHSHIKGPPGWPFLGNLSIFTTKNAAKEITKLREAYGSVVLLKLAGLKVVVIQDYKLVKEVLVTNGDKTSGRPHQIFDGEKRIWGGGSTGIMMNEGESFKNLKRFTSVALRDFGVGKQTLEDRITEEMGFLIGPLLEAEKTYTSGDFKEMCQISMLNTVVHITFGQRFAYDHPSLRIVVRAISQAMSISPLACPENYISFLKHLPGFPNKLETFNALNEALQGFLKHEIDGHRETFDPTNIRDFADLFLKQEAEEKASTSSSKVTAQGILRTMADLFLGGSETTSTFITWVIFFLCNNPDVQEKMEEEISRVVGVGRQILYSDRQKMPYIEAVTNEALRLGNTVSLQLPHTVTEGFSLSGAFIPKDSILIINADSIHMDRDYWGDPDVFRPERWLDNDGNLVKHEAFIPFGLGPRLCIGDQVAKTELFLFLTNLVQKVRISFPNKETGRPVQGELGLLHRPTPYDLVITPRTS